jgi:AbrB family looped-hinge helix DNA binding protein
MNLIKLGKKGQVSIPQGVLRQLGIAPDTQLLVETTDDGAIVLRQVSVHPIEIYSDERLAEFAREDAMTPAQARKYAPQLARFDAWLQGKAHAARPVPHAAEPAVPYRVRAVPVPAPVALAATPARARKPAARGTKA